MGWKNIYTMLEKIKINDKNSYINSRQSRFQSEECCKE